MKINVLVSGFFQLLFLGIERHSLDKSTAVFFVIVAKIIPVAKIFFVSIDFMDLVDK